MARPSQLLTFEIDVSDVDRGVYEQVNLRIAQHPSETDIRMLARVIAYSLHHRDELQFSKGGLSNGDDPALFAQDLTGTLSIWLDVGQPSSERLHRASKRAPRVIVYSYNTTESWLTKLRAANLYEAETIEIFSLDADGLKVMAEGLQRRNRWSLLLHEGLLLVTAGEVSASWPHERHYLKPLK